MRGLSEHGITPKIFTGVSVGALNATLAAQYGAGSENLWRFWRDITRDEVYTSYGVFRTVYRVLTKGGLMNSRPLEEQIEKLIHPSEIVASGNILRVGATNLNGGTYEEFGPEDPLFKAALLASTTIPMTVPPVYINGEPYVDGGVRNITPIGAAIKHKPDRIIIVGTQPRSERSGYPNPVLGSKGLGFIKHAIDTVVEEGFESDFREFERINEIMAIEGNTHPRYRYIPCTSIFPTKHLGSGMEFTPALHRERFELGYANALAILESN